jgi:hypothetical protein
VILLLVVETPKKRGVEMPRRPEIALGREWVTLALSKKNFRFDVSRRKLGLPPVLTTRRRFPRALTLYFSGGGSTTKPGKTTGRIRPSAFRGFSDAHVWVREKRLVSIEDRIKKMTSRAAHAPRLPDNSSA